MGNKIIKNSNSPNEMIKENTQNINIFKIKELEPKIKEFADVKLLWNCIFPETNFCQFSVKNGLENLNLVTYRYCLSKDPICVVILFHGLNSHLNSGAYMAQKLAENEICVVGFDQRGFGRSDGMKSYIKSLDILISDSKVFVELIKELYPNKPIFIGGHSMGGLITYRLTLENKNICNGSIYLAPALKSLVGNFVTSIGILLGKVIPTIKTFKPRREQGSKSEFSVKMIKHDPLTYNEGARMISIKAILEAMRDCENTFKDYDANYIMFFGGQDKLVDPESGFTMHKQSKSNDKTLYFYENLYHDVWHEEEMFDIVPKVLDWIKNRIPLVDTWNESKEY